MKEINRSSPENTAFSKYFLLLAGCLLLGAAVLGWRAWQGSRQAVVEVTWSTSSELDTAGFNLYRGESPAGPFTRLNAALILASGDPLGGGDYRFEDRGAEAGRLYYYRLEEVENSGAVAEAGLIEIRAEAGEQVELPAALALLLLAAVAASRAISGRGRARPALQVE